jgi:hypothetical protein
MRQPMKRVRIQKIAYLKDLSRMVQELPILGDEAESFKKDLLCIAQEQPPLPQKTPWK